jgi:hypothetical protein
METGQLECIKIGRRAAVIIIVSQKIKGTIVNIIQGRQEVRINTGSDGRSSSSRKSI